MSAKAAKAPENPEVKEPTEAGDGAESSDETEAGTEAEAEAAAETETDEPQVQPPLVQPRRTGERVVLGLLIATLITSVAVGAEVYISGRARAKSSEASSGQKSTTTGTQTETAGGVQPAESTFGTGATKSKDSSGDTAAVTPATTPAKRVAEMYAAMPPIKAAPLVEGLDVNMATQVLQLMAPDEAAGILAYMQTDRATAITQALLKATASSQSSSQSTSAAGQ